MGTGIVEFSGWYDILSILHMVASLICSFQREVKRTKEGRGRGRGGVESR